MFQENEFARTDLSADKSNALLVKEWKKPTTEQEKKDYGKDFEHFIRIWRVDTGDFDPDSMRKIASSAVVYSVCGQNSTFRNAYFFGNVEDAFDFFLKWIAVENC